MPGFNQRKTSLCLLMVLALTTHGCAQQSPDRPTGNLPTSNQPPCDGQNGCDEIHLESPVPLSRLNEVDTLPDFGTDPNRMLVTGVVLQPDGRTPASNVVLYVYHTNQQGIYPKRGNEPPVGRWHGYLRGWVKTNSIGTYQFYTCKPASYPNRNTPAHIHAHVKEPDKRDYYIDDFEFEDDELLTPAERQRRHNRGGSGICRLSEQNGLLTCRRNIVLGQNVPDYKP